MSHCIVKAMQWDQPVEKPKSCRKVKAWVSSTSNCNTPEHPRHPSAELKYAAIQRCFEQGDDVEYVSREIGYSRMSVYAWRRKYLKYGIVFDRNYEKREPDAQTETVFDLAFAPGGFMEAFTKSIAGKGTGRRKRREESIV